jgi:hypothetical protein
MMGDSLLHSLNTLKLSQEAQSVLDGMFGVSEVETANLVQHGFWHIGFFAQQAVWAEEDSNWIGVRLLPNVMLQDSPVVSVQRYGAVTISPTLKNLIPNWIIYIQLAIGNWQFIYENWHGVQDELRQVHLSLGGDSDFFDRLGAFVTDSQNITILSSASLQKRASLLMGIEQTSETHQFSDLLVSMMSDEVVLPKFNDIFRGWGDAARSAIATRAWNLRVNEKKSLLETVDLMWLGVDKAAPFDYPLSSASPIEPFNSYRTPQHTIHSLALSVSQPYTHLNEPAIPMHIQNDPLFTAVKTLGELSHISAYTGVQHMEAAAKLDIDLNDGKRSYEALISASFWSAMNLGFPYKQSYDAALHLAQKYGWDEMLENLELNNFEVQ